MSFLRTSRQQALAMPRAPVLYSQARLGAGVLNGVAYPGGLDQESPSLSIPPGVLNDGLNFELPPTGGYARIGGYERYNGLTSPSAASYVIVQVTSFVLEPTVGDWIEQATSGASGLVAAVTNGPTSFYMIVTATSGTFDTSHNLYLSGVNGTNPLMGFSPLSSGPLSGMAGGDLVGTATTTTITLTAKQVAQATASAADAYRDLIAPVPGTGNVLGVFGYINSAGTHAIYAFRADSTGTYVNLYKSSTTGWVNVPFFSKISFSTGGAVTPADGATLTQGGVTATVKRVMRQSGSWAANTAAGDLVITSIAGGAFAAGAATLSGGATITLLGGSSSITMLAGGRFEVVRATFTGSAADYRIYGCDGHNKAFEFDGTTLAPIATGLTVDTPEHIAYHKSKLFLTKGSAMLYSGTGEPFLYLTTNGGGEIDTGAAINGLRPLPGSQSTAAMAVYMNGNTAVLYGTDTASFDLQAFDIASGGAAYSQQTLGDALVFDDEAGVQTLKTTLNYGNFQSASLTSKMLKFVRQERTKVTASSANHIKSQYRVFFSDGYGLYLTVVNSVSLGGIPVLFTNPVHCMDTSEGADGTEWTVFGSNDGLGYVYQLDKGTSFDGGTINAYITLAWDFAKSPRNFKRYRAASIEVYSNGYANIDFGYKLGYGTSTIGQPTSVNYETNFDGVPYWDTFTWDAFTWDGITLVPTEVDMVGTGENVQFVLGTNANYVPAYTLNSLIYHYSPRRGMRV